MHHVQRVLFDFAHYPRQIAAAAPNAYQLRVGIYLLEPLYLFQLRLDVVYYVVGALLGRFAGNEELVGKGDGAELEYLGVQYGAAVVVNYLGGASAYFHYQPAGNIHRVYHALIHVVGFLILGNYRNAYARLVIHVGKKGLLVVCAAHGGGSHCHHLVHTLYHANFLEQL